MKTSRAKNPRRPPGGRPKDPDKRTAILNAARSLFFARGVEDIGIEEIAERAGVSKVTVYGHFGSKVKILSAVVEGEARQMAAALERLPDDARRLAERLDDFGVALLMFLTRPEILAFERLVIAQAARHPDMAEAMLEAGPRFGRRKLAEQLANATPSDGVSFPEPDVAAAYLMSLWEGDLVAELRLGVRPRPARAAFEARVRSASAFFLRGYRR